MTEGVSATGQIVSQVSGSGCQQWLDFAAIVTLNVLRSAADTAGSMVNFFEREGRYVRCETRLATVGAGYELYLVYPDGTEEIERFDDAAELSKRQQTVESSFVADGWRGPYGRMS